jgi:hypothetical protein
LHAANQLPPASAGGKKEQMSSALAKIDKRVSAKANCFPLIKEWAEAQSY